MHLKLWEPNCLQYTHLAIALQVSLSYVVNNTHLKKPREGIWDGYLAFWFSLCILDVWKNYAEYQIDKKVEKQTDVDRRRKRKITRQSTDSKKGHLNIMSVSFVLFYFFFNLGYLFSD